MAFHVPAPRLEPVFREVSREMPPAKDFREAIRRVRAGDPDAAADLVRRYVSD